MVSNSAREVVFPFLRLCSASVLEDILTIKVGSI